MKGRRGRTGEVGQERQEKHETRGSDLERQETGEAVQEKYYRLGRRDLTQEVKIKRGW